MWKHCFSAVLALFPWQSVLLEAQTRIPEVRFDVGVHRRVDGTQERSFHLMQVSCTDGHCTLVTVSFDGPWSCDLGALVPTIEVASTIAGQLVVSSSSTELVVRDLTWSSDVGGEASPAIYRFQYASPRGPGPITTLTGFSGGFTRSSSILGRVLAIELVPVATAAMSLPCPLRLRGIGR